LTGSGGAGAEPKRSGPVAFLLSETDREAFAYFRGNMSAVHRAQPAGAARLMRSLVRQQQSVARSLLAMASADPHMRSACTGAEVA
jgi:hypothetical protein